MVNSTSLQNLTRFDKLVNPDGTPTDFFMRLLQSSNDTTDGFQADINHLGAFEIKTTDPIIGGDHALKDVPSVTIGHDVSGVTAGTKGSATKVPVVTVDDKGHVTDLTDADVSINVEDEGGALGDFHTLDFAGAGVTATDAGGGVALVTIPGGGGGSGGGGLPAAKPPNSTLFNYQALAGGCTLAMNDGAGIFSILRSDGGAAAENCTFQGKAVPAGAAWIADMGFWTTPFGRSCKARCGLSLYESATGKIVNFIYNTENGAPQFFVFAYTNLTTFAAVVANGSNLMGGQFPAWFQIELSGGNYIFRISYDFGESYETLATVAVGTYFTTAADKIGCGLNTGTVQTPGDARMGVFYYKDPDFP
jgi:hypothetical protein